MQRRDEILDTCTFRMTFHIAQLANRLHAADLDALDLLRHEEFLERDLFGDLVVPDLDLDAAVQRAACLGLVARNRVGIAGPFIRDSLGRQRQRGLEVLGHLAGALARQPGVVAVDFDEPRRQRSAVGMADEVQAHVEAVLHAFENLGQRLDRRVRDVGNARFEADRRYEVGELDRFDLVLERLAQLDAIALDRVDAIGVLDPLRDAAVERQVTLGRLADFGLVDVLGHDGRGGQHEAEQQQALQFPEGVHSSTSRGSSGGPPRRQNTSGSTTSS